MRDEAAGAEDTGRRRGAMARGTFEKVPRPLKTFERHKTALQNALRVLNLPFVVPSYGRQKNQGQMIDLGFCWAAHNIQNLFML